MAVEAARVERDQAPMPTGRDARRPRPSCSTTSTTTTRSSRSPPASAASGSWLLDEHVVRGGEALIPGTGYLELARSAAAYGQPNRLVELRDVFFLSPFVVGDGEVRTLKVKLDRATDSVTVFSDTETSPHVTATAALVDAEPAPVHDLAAVRARCTRRVEQFDGYSRPAVHGLRPPLGQPAVDRVRRRRGRRHHRVPDAVRGRARRPVAAPGADGHGHGQRPGADPRLHPGRDVLRAVLVRPRAARGDHCRSGRSATSVSAPPRPTTSPCSTSRSPTSTATRPSPSSRSRCAASAGPPR